MTQCDACRELIGKPETTERHAGLAAFTSRKIQHSWYEMYMCRACGTKLQRVLTEPGSGVTGTPWYKVG